MADYSDRPGERASYRVSEDPTESATERRRLELLGNLRDRRSARELEEIGIAPGWRCLDVGSGGGSLARWMADRVGPGGSVLSTDIDVRFQPSSAGNLEVRQHDIVKEALPEQAFDLVHARAVLQTIEQREAVLDKLVRAAKPGAWIVVGDPDWTGFAEQPLPDAFRALYDAMMTSAAQRHGYDPGWARRLLAAFQQRKLLDIEAGGRVDAMHGGTESAEWLILAYERAAAGLIAAGLIDGQTVAAGLEAARREDFLIMGPLRVTARGRRP
jgi:ubiquinone/menaquinone biosynthesis C-methylase UbiE